jgi:phthiocerol/phenolphthiocerol synthesis type-I polyketide synthase E
MTTADGIDPVAVVGIAVRVPGARTVEQFWRNTCDGVESVSWFSRDELIEAGVAADVLDEPDYVRAGAVIDAADEFDAAFFGFNPQEAETMDPQHRVFCECAWAALEDSGHDPARFAGPVGVFAGSFLNKYLTANLANNRRFQRSPMAPTARIFNDKDFLATRIAYLFDLGGPAVTVQTACSTSLVATHLACQSLLGFECDLALAGGVTVNVPLKSGYPVSDGGLFSPEGRCRPFDARAQGTIPGNGAAVVVLRRLSDALADGDNVHAVIRSSAVNNDGALKAGFAAPSVAGQAQVIATAHALARIDPATIGYLEAHGTGTRVGDPIEVAALTEAFGQRTADRGFCALGSAKANIGHLDAAAGAVGLVRAVLALEHQQIPPVINFDTPNPELKLEQTPFYIPTAVRDWPRGNAPRRAGVSSFGVGGTNAHVLLEEAPAPAPRAGAARPWQLLPVSGRTAAAAGRAAARLADHLDQHPELDLGDVAFTFQDGRRHFAVRRFAVAADSAAAAEALRSGKPSRPSAGAAPAVRPQVVFMLPGGGAQHHDMGIGIYRSERVYREEVDRCAEILLPRLGFDLRRLLFPSLFAQADERQNSAMGRSGGPAVVSALFVAEYALARLWISWGVAPRGMIGHSLGEYVAACLADVMSLPDALDLTLSRGELFARMQPGRMLAVALAEDKVLSLLSDRVSVSAVNAPELTIVAGPDADIDELADQLDQRDIDCRRINVPVASHSWMVEPFLGEFERRVAGYRLSPPRLPFVSCVTGTWIRPDEAIDPRYWARHLRQPVRFAHGIAAATAEPGRVLLEVGPGNTLTRLAAAQRMVPPPVAVASMPHPKDPQPDLAFLMGAVGRLWQAGVAIDWQALHGDAAPRRVPLPTYPFESRRHWISPDRHYATETLAPDPDDDPGADASSNVGPADPVGPAGAQPEPFTDRERQVAQIWRDLLGVEQVGLDDDFFDLGGQSLMIVQLTRELRRIGGAELTAKDVIQAATVAGMAALLDAGSAASSHAAPDLAADVVLADEIHPAPPATAPATPPATVTPSAAPAPPPISAPRVVLLTGATGFIGAYLCAELLRQTAAEVVCLVRGSGQDGSDRLRAKLDSFGLLSDQASRIRAVPGDLTQPLLGLPEAEFRELAGQVDAIYHCGAWVNFVRPYRALRQANVGGTHEVLRLAAAQRLTPVHHISSLAALAGAVDGGASALYEDAELPPPVGHDTAYSQTKWVAEGLVRLARSRGIPVSVYRPSFVLGDSRTGVSNSEDHLTKAICGCVQLGLAPLRESELAIASVDHVSRVVVALSLREKALGKTFHTVDPRPLPWNRVFDYVRAVGYPVRSVPYDEWRRELAARVGQGADNSLTPLTAVLDDAADRPAPRIDCANLLACLPEEATSPPPADADFFGRMLRFFARSGWLPVPQEPVPQQIPVPQRR